MRSGLSIDLGISLSSPSVFSGSSEVQPPEPTLYVNPELAGGADLTTPPANHGSGFGTTTGIQSDEYAPGFFEWLFNAEEASGRGYLTYQLFQNNPTLTVGETYVFSYQVQKLNAGNYGATLNASSTNGITVVTNDVVIGGNTTKRCSIVFTVDAPIYSAQFRIGNGTTSDNTAHMLYTRPRLQLAGDVESFTNEFTEEFK